MLLKMTWKRNDVDLTLVAAFDLIFMYLPFTLEIQQIYITISVSATFMQTIIFDVFSVLAENAYLF